MKNVHALVFAAMVVATTPVHAQVQECVDVSLINPEAVCPAVVDPVCGCDGVTYMNSCEAQTQGGVTSWTEGTCVVESCTDVAGVDFGECEFVLGIAQVNGACQTISGCDYVVNGVDYSPAFFEDEPTCTMCNEVPPECGLQLLTSTEDGMWYTFEAIDVPADVELTWWIDDFLAQTGGLVFEAGFDFNPFWSVCAQYESAPCGGLVEQCYSNVDGVAPCTDLAGVDFGLCEMAMGVANVGGTCQFVSGCGSYVGGVNYAGAFFDSMESCMLQCNPGGTLPGCVYPEACNFNPLATEDDGSCTFPPFGCGFSEGTGCMYPGALNYDPWALVDNGSCQFAPDNTDCPGDVDGDNTVGVSDILTLLGQFGAVCD